MKKTSIIFPKRAIKNMAKGDKYVYSQYEKNPPVVIILLFFKNIGCLKKQKCLIITLQTERLISSHWLSQKIFIQISTSLVTVFTHNILWGIMS